MLNYFSQKSDQALFIYLVRNTDGAKVTGEQKKKKKKSENISNLTIFSNDRTSLDKSF